MFNNIKRRESEDRGCGQNVEEAELCTSESHHFGLFRFGFLHWDVNVLIVRTHVVGQPGKCHCVS